MINIDKRIALFKKGYWEIPEGLDTSNFDFTWRPEPHDRPYIHQFGTQWQKTGGPRFVIPENEGVKYQSHQHAIRLRDESSRAWRPLKSNISFDYSWHPDDNDPPYIYIFGNQWYDSETMPTVQYRVKGATEKKYVTDIRARLEPCMDRWVAPDDIKDFDYSWVPHPYDPPGINYQFGTQHQKTGGPTYITENSHTTKYVDFPRATKLPDENNRCWRPLVTDATIDYSWHPDDTEPPYIYVFGNQWYDSKIMPTFQYRVKGATEKKYVDLKATLLANTEYWVTPGDIEDNFDYSWRPNPHDPPLIYQFGTQWQKTGGPVYFTPDATTVKYIDYPKATKKANMRMWRIPEEIEDGFDFTWHPDETEPAYIYEFGTQHQKTGGPLYVTKGATYRKYCDAQIAKRTANMRKWRIIEDINKESFDFTWHPDETDGLFNYVFGNQYHSTEFMPTVMYRSSGAMSNKYITTPRAELSIGKTTYDDSLFDAMWLHTFDEKYVHFQNSKHPIDYSMLIPKYDPENLYIHLIDNVEAVIPKGIKNHFFDNLTDYPYVIHHNLGTYVQPLDIVFFSNGEECAEDNYQHLLSLNLPNRIVRVDGVNGRVKSQHAAANASNTGWYFLVNAKLKINENFDFNWQPNRYKSRRHFIFTATNPVNNLEYGHMAMVANNKRLTLETVVRGLDFTLDSKHEVVDINSGVAVYNSSAWDTWRTSFRECIKLCNATDDVSKERLEAWLTVGNGEFAEYSIMGAKDALAFYQSVNGEMTELMKSYDWDWLKTYYQAKSA